MTVFSNQVASWLSSGEDFLTQGDYDQARVAFEQALSLAQQSCNPQAEVLALQRLGHTHLGQGQPTRSVALIEQAIAVALKQHNLHALYECHRQLAATYKSINGFELALHHLEAAEGLRDRIPMLAEPSLYNPSPATPEKDAVLLLFRSIVEQANMGVAIFQGDRLVYSNPCLSQWVGCDDLDLRQLTLNDLVTFPTGPEDFPLSITTDGAKAGQLCSKAGQVMEVEVYATTVDYGAGQKSNQGRRPALVTFLRDITEARRLEDQLKASEARYRSLIHHVPIGLCRFSVEGRPLDANPALLAIFGFDTLSAFLQASPIQPTSPVTDQDHAMSWGSYLSLANPLKDCELKLSRPDGRERWVRVIARAVRETFGNRLEPSIPAGIADSNGTIQFFEAAVEDITEIKAAQTALEELAMRDSLTHVYNRRHFIELASHEITRSARFNHPITLLMVDIDHFKGINDTYGHLAGDTVLRDIALRLLTNLRQSDILARYGGEEFILLMPETDQSQAWVGAERLRTVIEATPFDSGGGSLSVTASIGLSCWPGSTDPSVIISLPHINDLISKADQALYRAKRSGRNQTQAEAWLHTVNSQSA